MIGSHFAVLSVPMSSPLKRTVRPKRPSLIESAGAV
jgi:hypothetical protein